MQVRKVEYRDKLDDEWDAFQKSIKAETQAINSNDPVNLPSSHMPLFQVSEALVEADDADIQDDRQIVEWTEQRC